MDVRVYWRIIARRWWLPVGLALAVVLISVAIQRPWQPRPATYSATMRFNVGIQPERIPGVYTYDRYYTMLTSEYLVDDLGEIVRSQAFAAAVSRRLAERGMTVGVGAIGSATQPGKLHRILTVSVSGGDPAQLQAIAEAISATLTEEGAEFFGQFSAEEADIRLIDAPAVALVAPSPRQQLDLPLRALLGLAAGLALVFLWDYLDDSVRGREDLEQLGLPVLSEVPRR